MELRPHQIRAVAAGWGSLRAGNNPVLQLPTGTGKSLVAAELARMMHQKQSPVWVVTHVQELVRQNANAYYAHTQHRPGVICAGLERSELYEPVTFGTVQSMINPLRGGMLQPPRLIIVDEVHRVPHNRGEASLYKQMFELCPEARRVGLSATPWRTDNGLVYGTGAQFWFDERAFYYTVPDAVKDGWLSPLVGVESTHQLDVEELPVNDDFVAAEVEKLQTENWLSAMAESVAVLAGKRAHVAVYCSTVLAAERAAGAIARATGWECGLITGGMRSDVRDDVLGRFKAGTLRVLCSVDTITTGFDFPALDCIVVLRPTVSSNLWVQIQGRGTRLHADKKNCLVLDYVGNYQRLGGVDMVDTYVRQGAPLEPLEALPAPPREKRRVLPGVRSLTTVDPMTGEQARDGAVLRVKVHAVTCIAVPTRRHKYPVLMISYACTTEEGARIDGSLFINTEQPDITDVQFFNDRRLAVKLPALAQSTQWQVRGSRQPEYVTVRKSGRYWNVITEEFAA
jgi:DNA repair protein RadD